MNTRPLTRDKIRWLLAREFVPNYTIEDFIKWLEKNKTGWEWFQKFTLQAIGNGKRYGAKAIAERVRWEVDFTHKKYSFKINNNYLAYMARLFCYKYVGQENYFKTRKVTGLKVAA